MILAACGGRDNGEKDAEGLARAESGEGSGKLGNGRWRGWTGRRGMVTGGVGGGDREGESGMEGGNGEGEMGRGAIGTGRGWQWRGGQGEEEMERGAMGKGGKMGRGQQGGGKGERGGDGEGEKKGQEEGRFHRWI